MKFLRAISAIFLSVWIVFVSMGLTFYQHVCVHTGDVQISVNAPVECVHESTESETGKVQCKHHCHKHDTENKDDKGGCCHKTQMTVYVKVEDKIQARTDVSPVYVALPFEYISVSSLVEANTHDYRDYYLRPPPDIGLTSSDILTLHETFLI